MLINQYWPIINTKGLNKNVAIHKMIMEVTVDGDGSNVCYISQCDLLRILYVCSYMALGVIFSGQNSSRLIVSTFHKHGSRKSLRNRSLELMM